MVVSDISCDINGSVEFLDRTCTIAQPFFQYNPLTRQEECADIGDKGITVMGKEESRESGTMARFNVQSFAYIICFFLQGTDILPAELPRESSDYFGSAVVTVLNQLIEKRSGDDGSLLHAAMDLQSGPPLLVSFVMSATSDLEGNQQF
jgi:hypothetical protein